VVGVVSDYRDARERLVERLNHRISRESTRAALLAVPRHAFVPEQSREAAYEDRPLPIGNGQTISAPHMVAEMLDALALEPGDRVLEIGTGCGYHAALTAEVAGGEHVYSVEYEAELADQARRILAELGYGDIAVRVGDGHAGWPEHAPYDAAYLTCAADDYPEAVVEQVRPNGRLLGPLGSTRQTLVFAEKRTDGSLVREDRGAVRFVPMRGGN
jgi:protein-L-isoaspartate(D-aspartate) O-methyltransferase